MSHRSLRGYVFLGVRIVCILALLGIAYHDYRQRGYLAVLGDLGFYLVVACLTYAMGQGTKLADANMRQHGLNPDREEGPSGL